jgi:hypothetical protein
MSEGDLRFSAAEVNLLLHATEDGGKVLQSLENTLAVPSELFSSSPSEGHYNNKIFMLEAMLASQEAGGLALRIMSLLNSSDRERLSGSLHEYSDEKGNLYLRLDKQRICQGKVSLSEIDAIRIRFKPVKRYRPSDNLESYRGLLSSTG